MAIFLNTPFDDFIDAECLKPFNWGDTDCVSSVNRFCEKYHGMNLLKRLGWNWSNESEAMARIKRYGTLRDAAEHAFGQCGYNRVDISKLGDCGVLSLPGSRLALAIYIGDFWWYRPNSTFGLAPDRRVIDRWRHNHTS